MEGLRPKQGHRCTLRRWSFVWKITLEYEHTENSLTFMWVRCSREHLGEHLRGYLGIRFCSTLITIYHQNFTQELFLVFEKNWDFFLKNTALEANSVASALLLASFMDNCFLKHSKDFVTFLGSSYTFFFVFERSSLDFVNQLVDDHAECPIFHPFLSGKKLFDVRFSNYVI